MFSVQPVFPNIRQNRLLCNFHFLIEKHTLLLRRLYPLTFLCEVSYTIELHSYLAILNLLGSRFTASEIFAILESPAVHRKFDMVEADLALVRKWLAETRIRWGIDGENRSQLGLPALGENTWKAGLERLLLGYAFPGQDENMFHGILPYDQGCKHVLHQILSRPRGRSDQAFPDPG